MRRKFRWPWMCKKTHRKETNRLHGIINHEKIQSIEAQQRLFSRNELIDKLSRINIDFNTRVPANLLGVQIAIDQRMMESALPGVDNHVLEYYADYLAHQVKRELSEQSFRKLRYEEARNHAQRTR